MVEKYIANALFLLKGVFRPHDPRKGLALGYFHIGQTLTRIDGGGKRP
ncbi:hypothetical protein CCACVL1_03277 [Corchorus capsularis]|uniref:Uncharacterized protein n=1 Tax=Corchorus capsularis TaxID=210143 RepID=A0A1R3K177_COCAP|nr:hypothetical protein CCACVL1_03277 [Corchorus capsularis]